MSEVQAGTRGPNYDWKHEAQHYRAECDKLRTLLGQSDLSAERDIAKLTARIEKLQRDASRAREKKRFEAACAAMTGGLASSQFRGTDGVPQDELDACAKGWVACADALLTALSESKEGE